MLNLYEIVVFVEKTIIKWAGYDCQFFFPQKI